MSEMVSLVSFPVFETSSEKEKLFCGGTSSCRFSVGVDASTGSVLVGGCN